jgi:ABC-type multidrug transport system fused ATPase/permease subunit
VLKGMSFEVKRNKVVALVGKSGCGKSSIIAVLERYYNLKGGEVAFDG